jgi:lipoprotein-anchoring transpeptidase ErfK/SrfK
MIRARTCSSCASSAVLIAAAFACGPARAESPFNFFQPQPQSQVASYFQPTPQFQAAPEPVEPQAADENDQLAPRLRRQIVGYPSKEVPGTIIIDTRHTYLYYVLGGGKAIRYGIGVGRKGFTWSGVKSIVRKTKWPDWYPPPEMLKRQPYLPRMMAGGPGNPLGARAMYIGGTEYRIHGTNNPSTIGTHVSSGCIRMTNDNAIDLYNRVKVGAEVVVLPQNGAATHEAKAPPQNWLIKAKAAIKRAQQDAPRSLSYAAERKSRAHAAWNVIGRDGLY